MEFHDTRPQNESEIVKIYLTFLLMDLDNLLIPFVIVRYKTESNKIFKVGKIEMNSIRKRHQLIHYQVRRTKI